MTDPHDREPIDDATIAAWRLNYCLDKRTPAQASKWWSDAMLGMAPAGCVAALGVALDELEAVRKDAARYRWLRDKAYTATAVRLVQHMPGEMDGAIDHAMQMDASRLGVWPNARANLPATRAQQEQR